MIFKRRGRSEGGVKKISDVFFDMLYDVAVIIGNRNIC